jgi:hypothetical protein
MTELAYGHGLRDDRRQRVALSEADLMPDIDYAEALLVLADHAVRHEGDLDRLLFALAWARFDHTVAGMVARHTVCLHMDRCDVRYEVRQTLLKLLGSSNAELAAFAADRIIEAIDFAHMDEEPMDAGIS